jgi:hypothetical protein
VPNDIRSVYKAMNDIKKMFDRVKEWQQNVHGVCEQFTALFIKFLTSTGLTPGEQSYAEQRQLSCTNMTISRLCKHHSVN